MSKANYVSDSHDKMYSDFVQKYREDVGRIIKVHLQGSRVKCPNCLWSPTDKKSSGVYRPTYPWPTGFPVTIPFSSGPCPMCQGVGQYTRTVIKNIKCHVHWLVPGDNEKTQIGLLEGFDCRLQADIKHINDFRNAVKVEIDGSPMEVKKLYQRGLKKICQVLIFLTRSDFNKPSSATNVTYGAPV